MQITLHISDIKYNKKNTALVRLLNIEPLQINWKKDSKIIYPSSFYSPPVIIESIEIYISSGETHMIVFIKAIVIVRSDIYYPVFFISYMHNILQMFW